jgi:hypothetical protein
MGTTIVGGILSGGGGGSGGVVADINEQIFTAGAGQTVFSLSPTVNTDATVVFVNGVKLLPEDFTLTTSQLTLAATSSLNDEVSIIDWVATGSVSGGSTSFTGLTDTPGSYSGNANKVVIVNSAGTALEFIATSSFGGGGSGGGIRSKQTITATGGQTVFSLSTTLQDTTYAQVFRQGHLMDSTDYTLTTTQLTLNNDADAGDIVTVIEFGPAGAVASGSVASGESTVLTITAANTFGSGDVIRANGSGWALSDASVPAESEVLGIVETANTSQFTVVTHGKLTLSSHGFALGSDLFLSETAGNISTSDVAVSSSISKPIGSVIDADNIHVNIMRGVAGSGIAASSAESWTVVSGTVNSVNGGFYFVSPSDTINLPTTPANNDTIVIAQGSGDLSATSANVSGGSNNISDNINTPATTWSVDDNFAGRYTFTYNSTLGVWKVT